MLLLRSRIRCVANSQPRLVRKLDSASLTTNSSNVLVHFDYRRSGSGEVQSSVCSDVLMHENFAVVVDE